MELLLNLAWVFLALPAYWLWRASAPAREGRKFTALQCLLALGCMLVILFPVVSATDDLHAMRAEMEESPASKRAMRQAGSDRVSPGKRQSPPAMAVTPTPLVVFYEFWQPSPSLRLLIPSARAVVRAGRAPPALPA